MSEGTLQGSIRIDTSSVEEAVKQVSNLRSTLYKYARANSVLGEFNKTFNGHIKSYRLLSQTADEFAAAQKRADTIISKAANTVEGFNHKIRTSNLSVEKQSELILAANSNLSAYSSAVKRGATSGIELSSIQTQLNNSLSELNRQYKDYVTQTSAANKIEDTRNRLIAQADVQYTALAADISATKSSEADRQSVLTSLKNIQSQFNSELKAAGNDTKAVSNAQLNYKKRLIEVRTEIKKLNSASRTAELSAFADEFKNLTSSVVVALGPLSGVASRLIALQGIFNRNAIGLAALLASITGLSVVLNASFNNAVKAETRFNRLSSQLEILGGKAQFTASELSIMGDKLADATLGGTDEFRDAASSLLQFGEIGRDSFEKVIVTAYGMSSVLGGSLKESIRKVGKSMQDPLKAFEQLRESGVQFSLEAKQQISILTAQGKKQEAQAVILKELSGYYNAAMKEGQGMSGAIDAVSVAFQSSTESIYKDSEAYKQLTSNTFEFAKSIREFTDSPYFQLIKDLADTALSGLSSAIDVAKGSFSALAGIMAAIFAKYAVSGTMRILTLSGAFAKSLVPSVSLSTEALKKNLLATKLLDAGHIKLAKSIGIVGIAFKTLPIVAFVAGLYSAYSAIKSFREEANSYKNVNVSEVLSDDVANLIKNSDYLTDIEKKVAQDRFDQYKNQYEDLTSQLRYWEKRRAEIVSNEIDKSSKNIQNAVDKQVRIYETMKNSLGETDPRVKAAADRIEELRSRLNKTAPEVSKVDSEISKLKQSLADVGNEAQKFAKDPLGLSKIENNARKILETRAALKSLNETYGENSSTLEQYELDLKAVDNIMNMMSNADFASFFTQKDVTNISRIRAEVSALIDKATGNTGKSDSIITGLDDNIVQANRLYIELNSIGDLLDSGKLSDFDKKTNMDKVFDEILTMSEEAKIALRDSLGATSTDVQDLFNAYKRESVKGDDYITFLKQQIQYSNDVKSAMENLRPSINSVSESYGVLISKALAIGDSRAAEDFTAKMKKEMEDIRRLGDKATAQAGSSYSPFAAMFMTPDEVRSKAEEQMQAIRDANGRAVSESNVAIDQIKSNLESLLIVSEIGYAMQGLSDIFSGAMSAMKDAGKDSTATYRRMARAQILMSQSMAIASAWASAYEYGGHPAVAAGLASAQTALITATMVQQLANVNAGAYATGGYVSGNGTSTSDSIPALLSNGEYVINAAAVKKLGIGTLNALNNGMLPTPRAEGGSVGLISGVNSMNNSSGIINIEIYDQSSGSDKEYVTTQETASDGTRNIKIMIKEAVKEAMRNGEFDKAMSSNYGAERQARRR